MSEKELQKEIADLKAQIKKLQKNNLGLVFEDKKEDVVTQCEKGVPVLKEVKTKRITTKNRPNNLLIEGDNYHALSVLNYTHKKSVDLIYIDPPYNTGNKDFIYNDHYIDKEDGYRHSKWLSFMSSRLYLAKDLLKDDGAIFISIDDNEHAHLRILCDKIFGAENFRNTIIVRRRIKSLNSQFAHQGLNSFNVGFEYILVYARSSAFLMNAIRAEKEKISEKGRWDVFWSGANRPTMRYEILGFTPATGQWRYSKDKAFEAVKNYQKYLSDFSDKVSLEDYWRMTGEQLRFIRKIQGGKGKNGGIQHWVPPRSSTLRTSNWLDIEVSEIKKELDFGFDNPKNPKLMEELFKLTSNNATILDFFAGSGTTGHAILRLNSKDGGSRKFILCTNNENNNGGGKKIAADICYPRIKKVIDGYADTNGVQANLHYYQTDFVDVDNLYKISDDGKIKVTYEAGQMIAVREDTLNEVEKNEWWQIFEGQGKITAIYFKEDKSRLGQLIEKLEKTVLSIALYIFSWGKNEYKGEFSSANIRVEDIPEPILEVYKEINRL